MNQTPDQLLNDRLAGEKSKKDSGQSERHVKIDGDAVRISDSPALFNDVVDFHRKFKIQYDGPPRDLDDKLKKFRVNRLKEEFCEYVDAIEDGDFEGQLDAIVDLIYIALGTAHLHGWDFNEAWRRVHRANMAKVNASPDNPGKFEYISDIVKPPGWVAPSHKDLV